MTETGLDPLAAGLAAGESLMGVLEGLRPAGEQELLKRCAAVHTFDAGLLDALRSIEPEVEVDLAGLLATKSVEVVPGHDDLYRIPEAQRRERYERWWAEAPGTKIPDALLTVTRRVLEHFETAGGDDVELLYHQLLLEPEKALDRFETLFAEWARRYDVARCHDLIDVLSERLALLGPPGAAVRNESARWLRSLEMWTRDWYRSERFLPPGDSAMAMDRLLKGNRGRTLVIWSGSGMGKTSHLRWLIARRCVPEGHACARVDFDVVDPLIATQEPWLVLLEAAAQLDRQLTDAPFHELLSQHAEQIDRLHARPGAAPAAAPQSVADDIVARFRSAVREIGPEQCVVLVLDTFEEALLLRGGGPETDLSALLGMLSGTASKAPAVRLVLASRYALSDRVVDYDRLLPKARELHIEPFTRSEARRYVTRHRGIHDPKMVAGLVRGAKGIPFNLELLCDTAEQRPDLTPAEVIGTAQVELDYVMNRIVARLDERLQPLLRYGVVPRTLERAFVRDVVSPVLGEPLHERWADLKRYAGVASWVTLDPVDADAVRFHVAVLDPMRKLLADDPEHDELQRRASAWFEARAADQPARATRHLCEAVYHRFQFEGPEAEQFWRLQLEDARAAERPDRRRALAAEVLRDDYVDGAKPRTWRDGQTVLRPETVLRARWELAIAAVQLAHEDTRERREAAWLEAERAVDDLQHLRESVKRAPFTDAELALLKAGIRLGRGDLAGAEEHVARALRGHLLHEDRLWLWIAYADCAARLGLEESASHFKHALRLAGRGRNPGADRAAVLLRLGRQHAERDRFDRGLEDVDKGLETAEGRTRLELALVRAALHLRSGAPNLALPSLDEASDTWTAEEPELVARRGIVGIRVLLACGRPLEALTLAEQTGAHYSTTLQLGGAREQAVAAEGRELRGKVQAALLDVEAATRDLEEAANRWSRLGSLEGVCRCWVRRAAFQLRGMLDLNQAEVLLDQARRTHAPRGHDAWTRCTLVGAELLARRGRPARARRLVDDVIAALEEHHRPPRAFVEAAQHGLIVGDADDHENHLRLLCVHLARITPPGARLAALEGLEYCPPLSASRELRRRLRGLLPSPVDAPEEYVNVPPMDRALLALVDADVERVLGHTGDAQRALDHAAELLADGGPDAARQRLLLAAVRTGHAALATTLAEQEVERVVLGTRTPMLDASVLVQVAERLEASPMRRRAIEVASRIVDDRGAAAGGWLARTLDLRAQCAEDDEDEPAARTLWRQAAAAYAVLGEDQRSREIVARHPPDERPEAVSVARNEIRLTLRLVDKELRLSVRVAGSERVLHRRTRGPQLIASLVKSAPAVTSQAVSPIVVQRLMKDATAVGEELGTLLIDAVGPNDGLAAGNEPLEVGLRTKDTAVRALPWELGVPALRDAGLGFFRRAPRTRGRAHDTRGLQGALNRVQHAGLALDGIDGPRTRVALRTFQAAADLPETGEADPLTVQRLHAAVTGEHAPWVAIVRPSRRAEELTGRGSRQSGVPVDWMYQLHGFQRLVLDASTADQLQQALRRRPVAIVHLNLGLVDHHGTAAIDLLPPPAAKGRPPGVGRVTGTAFDALLPQGVPQPLVVLDPPGPKTRRERVMQLLLRNAFASELAAVGSVRAVLGTGLTLYVGQQRLYDALIGALSDGHEVREVVERVRAAGREDPLTFPATALFARTPGIRFPAPNATWD